MADIKKLQAYARSLRETGTLSEPEIRRSVDQLEARLDRESEAERPPVGLTKREMNNLNFERAHEGKTPFTAADDEEDRPDLHRDLSRQTIDSLNFERAMKGEAPLSANEIARESIRRATAGNADLPDYAPKGMHPARFAQENLRRACKGEAPLLPHEDEE